MDPEWLQCRSCYGFGKRAEGLGILKCEACYGTGMSLEGWKQQLADELKAKHDVEPAEIPTFDRIAKSTYIRNAKLSDAVAEVYRAWWNGLTAAERLRRG